MEEQVAVTCTQLLVYYNYSIRARTRDLEARLKGKRVFGEKESEKDDAATYSW